MDAYQVYWLIVGGLLLLLALRRDAPLFWLTLAAFGGGGVIFQFGAQLPGPALDALYSVSAAACLMGAGLWLHRGRLAGVKLLPVLATVGVIVGLAAFWLSGR